MIFSLLIFKDRILIQIEIFSAVTYTQFNSRLNSWGISDLRWRLVVLIIDFNLELEVVRILLVLVKFKCVFAHALTSWLTIVVIG